MRSLSILIVLGVFCFSGVSAPLQKTQMYGWLDRVQSLEESKGVVWAAVDQFHLMRWNQSKGTVDDFNPANSPFPGFESYLEDFNKRIAIDKNGLCWTFTDSSVIGTDGKTWTVIKKESNTIFTADDRILSVVDDNEGNIYFQQRTSVVKYSGISWEKIPLPAEVKCYWPTPFAVDKNKVFWLADNNGRLWSGRESAWTRYDTLPQVSGPYTVKALERDNQGDVWIALTDRIMRFSGLEVVSIPYKTDDTLLAGTVIGAKLFDKNRIYITSQRYWIDGYLYFTLMYDGSNWTRILPSDTVLTTSSMALDRVNRRVWFGSSSKARLWNTQENGVQISPDPVALDIKKSPGTDGENLFCDAQNRLWFYFAEENTVGYCDGATWAYFAIPDSGPIIQGFYDSKGVSWFLSPYALYEFQGSTFNKIPLRKEGETKIAHAGCADPKNGVWVITDSTNITGDTKIFKATCFYDQTTRVVSLPDSLFYQVNVCGFDRNNVLWIGGVPVNYSKNGLIGFDGASWIQSSMPDSGHAVLLIDIARDNSKWISTYNGLFHEENKGWKVFNMANSLLPYPRILSMALDKKGNLWAESHKRGGGSGSYSASMLVCLEKGDTNFTLYPQYGNRETFGCGYITNVKSDSLDRIWFNYSYYGYCYESGLYSIEKGSTVSISQVSAIVAATHGQLTGFSSTRNTLAFNSPFSGQGTMRIFNSLGRAVVQNDTKFSAGMRQRFPVTLGAGLYLLEVKTKNNVALKRFVVR